MPRESVGCRRRGLVAWPGAGPGRAGAGHRGPPPVGRHRAEPAAGPPGGAVTARLLDPDLARAPARRDPRPVGRTGVAGRARAAGPLPGHGRGRPRRGLRAGRPRAADPGAHGHGRLADAGAPGCRGRLPERGRRSGCDTRAARVGGRGLAGERRPGGPAERGRRPDLDRRRPRADVGPRRPRVAPGGCLLRGDGRHRRPVGHYRAARPPPGRRWSAETGCASSPSSARC